MGNINNYKIDVGVKAPYIPDIYEDLFEVMLPISDEEVKAIMDAAVRHYWDSEAQHLDSWEYIEVFAPEAYKKAVALAEAYCVPRWGDVMKVENGAGYEFFLPDEIEDSIWGDNAIDAMKQERNIRKRQRKESSKHFHGDAKMLYNAYQEGRFGDKLKRDPVWDNQIFSGLWTSGGHEYAAQYSIHTIVMNEIEFGYQRIYKRDDVEFRVEIRPPINTFVKGFFNHYGGQYKYEDFVSPSNSNPPVIITKSKGNLHDLEFYMSFLDYLTRL